MRDALHFVTRYNGVTRLCNGITYYRGCNALRKADGLIVKCFCSSTRATCVVACLIPGLQREEKSTDQLTLGQQTRSASYKKKGLGLIKTLCLNIQWHGNGREEQFRAPEVSCPPTQLIELGRIGTEKKEKSEGSTRGIELGVCPAAYVAKEQRGINASLRKMSLQVRL